jgi:DNA-binding XRE family transcriptional regulator
MGKEARTGARKKRPSRRLDPLARKPGSNPGNPRHIRARLGRRLGALRRRRNWGQADLAAISGLERSYISRIENGRMEIGLTTLEVLANSFDMTVSQFMRGV